MRKDLEDVEHALLQAAKNAPGGITGCATVSGQRAGDLIGRLSPSDPTHFPRLQDLCDVLTHGDDIAPLELICELFGGQFTTRSQSKSGSVIKALLHAVSETADVARAGEKVLADGKLTKNEKREWRGEISEARRALTELENEINNAPTVD